MEFVMPKNSDGLTVVSLNIWGGKIHDSLMEFIDSKRDEADAFCFQEVYSSPEHRIMQSGQSQGAVTDIYQCICDLLPEHRGFFFPCQAGYNSDGPVDFPLDSGNAIFVRRDAIIQGSGYEFVHGHRDSLDLAIGWHTWPRNVCWVKVARKDCGALAIMTLHGVWGKDKLDSSERIAQSIKVARVVEKNSHDGYRIVLCGDFNLEPQTEAMVIMRNTHAPTGIGRLRNLIETHHITDTRTPLYRHYNTPGASRYADQFLISKSLMESYCKVCPEVVSDHAALEVGLKAF
jgi:endonuclease/exonuclease/phosphatase family metal-dependent hydrolase